MLANLVWRLLIASSIFARYFMSVAIFIAYNLQWVDNWSPQHFIDSIRLYYYYCLLVNRSAELNLPYTSVWAEKIYGNKTNYMINNSLICNTFIIYWERYKYYLNITLPWQTQVQILPESTILSWIFTDLLAEEEK